MKTSESIKSITAAMIEVQSKIKGIVPSASNPFFKSKYIPLDDILEFIRPILTQNEIWLTQNAVGDGDYIEVTTRLLHSSGEYVETDALKMKPQKNDPQQLGSCITYAKRYQLASLLGISSEVDDDGNKATHGDLNPNKRVTKEQAGEIRTLAKQKKISEEYICKFRHCNKFEELKEVDFKAAMEWLKKK